MTNNEYLHSGVALQNNEVNGHIQAVAAIFLVAMSSLDIAHYFLNPHFSEHFSLHFFRLGADGVSVLAAVYFMKEALLAYKYGYELDLENFRLVASEKMNDFQLQVI